MAEKIFTVTKNRDKLPPLEFTYSGFEPAPYVEDHWPSFLVIASVPDPGLGEPGGSDAIVNGIRVRHDHWALEHHHGSPSKLGISELGRYYAEQFNLSPEQIVLRMFNQIGTIKLAVAPKEETKDE